MLFIAQAPLYADAAMPRAHITYISAARFMRLQECYDMLR